MQLRILPATRLQNDSQSQSFRVAMLFRLTIIRMVVFGFCDFIAQCTLVRINHCTYHPIYSLKFSKIYRCWIVWGKNICVMIVPSFLAIAFISQSIYLQLINRFQFIVSESSYLASARWHIKNQTRRYFFCFLGDDVDSNRFGHIHGRECPGDGLDRVQDPQGILGI